MPRLLNVRSFGHAIATRLRGIGRIVVPGQKPRPGGAVPSKARPEELHDLCPRERDLAPVRRDVALPTPPPRRVVVGPIADLDGVAVPTRCLVRDAGEAERPPEGVRGGELVDRVVDGRDAVGRAGRAGEVREERGGPRHADGLRRGARPAEPRALRG